MSWNLKEREIEAVLAADGKHRYEYFVHRVCETRKVWGLYSEGWAALADGGEKLLPFWPHERYAARLARGAWDGYTPRAIPLELFLRRWLPGMKQEGVGAAIFPVSAGGTVLVTLDDLAANLRRELDEVHGEEV